MSKDTFRHHACCYLLPTSSYHLVFSFSISTYVYMADNFSFQIARGEGVVLVMATLIAQHKKWIDVVAHWKPKSQQRGPQPPNDSGPDRATNNPNWKGMGGWKRRRNDDDAMCVLTSQQTTLFISSQTGRSRSRTWQTGPQGPADVTPVEPSRIRSKKQAMHMHALREIIKLKLILENFKSYHLFLRF